MIEFTDDEVAKYDEHIESVYVEQNISLNNLKDPNVFNRTFKMGLSSSVPPGVSPDRIKDYCRLQISNYLKWEYNRNVGKKNGD